MKAARLFVALLLLPGTALAWRFDIAGTEFTGAGSVATDVTGDVFAGGDVAGPVVGSPPAGIVVKLAHGSGEELWRSVMADSAGGSVGAVAAFGGDVFAAGNLPGGFAVTRLAGDSGAPRWRGGANASADAAVVDADGDVLAAGFTGDDAGVLKLDGATGAERWRGGTGLAGDAIALDANGDAAVAGSVEPVPDSCVSRFAVAKLDGATGAERWRTTLFGSVMPGFEFCLANQARSIAVDAHGDVVVAGQLQDDGNSLDFVVVKLDGTTGAELWRYTIAERRPDCEEPLSSFCTADEAAAAVTLEPDGDAVATGFTGEYNTDKGPFFSTFTVVRLDGTSGALRWRSAVTGNAGGLESGRAITVAPGGDVVVGGTTGNGDACRQRFSSNPSLGTGSCNFTVARLNGDDGSLLWQQALGIGFFADRAGAVTVSAAGEAVAAGVTASGLQHATFTVAGFDAVAGGTGDCGNGVVEPGEQCDRAVTRACCSTTCQLEPAGTVCLQAFTSCMLDSVCDGTTTACPMRTKPDVDHDGVCDDFEACPAPAPVADAHLEMHPRADGRLSFTGTMLLTTPFEFLDPLHLGVRLRIVEPDGTAVTDVAVPAGAGWRQSANRREWRWTGDSGGVTRVVLVRDRRLVDELRFRVRASGASFTDPRLGGEMILYPQPLSPPIPVQCGLADFTGTPPAPACTVRRRDLRCR